MPFNNLQIGADDLFLFGDTETTGFVKGGALKQDGQARVCQLALLLTDAQGNTLTEFNSLIRPDGAWQVGAGAEAVHGFSTEKCQKHGMFLGDVIHVYNQLAAKATHLIAHNADFDCQMMEIEDTYMANYKAIPRSRWLCTMKEAEPIMNLPPTAKMLKAGFRKPKAPKLEEALKYFCKRDLGHFAHDAMYDVKACRDIFFALIAAGSAASLPVDADDIPDFSSRIPPDTVGAL
jgi:DNA polymerase III subunit epsilon